MVHPRSGRRGVHRLKQTVTGQRVDSWALGGLLSTRRPVDGCRGDRLSTAVPAPFASFLPRTVKG